MERTLKNEGSEIEKYEIEVNNEIIEETVKMESRREDEMEKALIPKRSTLNYKNKTPEITLSKLSTETICFLSKRMIFQKGRME
ncbi:hypothetical protein M0811_07915 [Anaeramoeba ignava]|uniref:Uncharacterized protein n=1 Tax=Anaeramoeba ignava TaxID=1746090 RepID=A0A9Q0LL72_ANAIG|nr:hypothetical protein M0811_07915 [Anaeramoeba ignava]